jgi:SAM-dependent methyltransferase
MSYGREWYLANSYSSMDIAKVVLHFVQPNSIVDLGCGRGAWLRTFKELGVVKVLGVDYGVPQGILLIPKSEYLDYDLTNPLESNVPFAMAICLETAEHLPAEAAPVLIESISKLSSLVLFSAAVPGQGGTHHVNEQLPAYWDAFFASHGYVPIDCLRDKIRNIEAPWWYRQNMVFYVHRPKLSNYPKLREWYEVIPNV